MNLHNATITGNTLENGAVFGAGIYSDGGTATLINSIVYYNRREGEDDINYNLNGYSMEFLQEYNITYSNVEGNEIWIPEGEGNINEIPLFSNPIIEDYSLQNGSPCIDAGTTNIDLYGWGEAIDNYYGSDPDMGAFECVGSSCFFDGDITMDYIIDILDIVAIVSIILDNWDPTITEFTLADINNNGVVDILDVLQIVQIIIDN